MKRKFILLVAFLSFISISSLAYADMHKMKEKHYGKGMKMEDSKGYKKNDLKSMFFKKTKMILKEAEELGLSDDQIDAVKKLKSDTKKSFIKIKSEIDTVKVDFEDAVSADEMDVSAVNSLIDKKYQLKAKKAKEIVAGMAKIKTILNEEQYTQFKDMCKNKMKEGWENKKMHKSKMMGKYDMHRKGNRMSEDDQE